MLAPRNVDQQLETALVREIQKPARGRVIDAQKVRAQSRNQVEVASGLLRLAEWFAGGIGGEGPVSDAFRIKLLAVDAEKLSADCWARRGIWSYWRHRNMLVVNGYPSASRPFISGF